MPLLVLLYSEPYREYTELSPRLTQFKRQSIWTPTTYLVKNAVFWYVTPGGSCKNRDFGGSYPLHRYGDKNRRARNNINRITDDSLII
jgi:hypothetical protein